MSDAQHPYHVGGIPLVIEATLPSRRHQVFLARTKTAPGDRYVVKEYGDDGESRAQEERIHDVLRTTSVAVPSLAERGDTWLAARHISGQTVLDLYTAMELSHNDPDGPAVRSLWTRLVRWLAELSAAGQSQCGEFWHMSDVNLRNFVVEAPGGTLYGVDLEQCGPGGILEDIGMAAAFAATYDPPCTAWKRTAAAALCEVAALHVDVGTTALHDSVERALAQLAQRRQCRFPPDLADSIVPT